ncbi:helix-turn-helix domain-containing protein [Geothrix oryzisoli]|uniref:helix-turn-helix domain-containing protein n=1 Tax=Geothrix oryzisoli TaxID=2922721 RepID=UPI001FAD7952|nr:AraC family transcriptional regulator [Geothrix oryzisoli]
MQVHSFAPGEALAPFVRAFEIIEVGAAMEKLLVPETGLILGFRYSGSSSLVDGPARAIVPDQVVTGLRATARRMLTSAGSGIILAKFRAGAAGAFFDPPLQQLFGATVALEELMDPREVEAASARIRAAWTHRERVDALEQFLLRRRARKAWQADPLVGAALRAIHADPGAMRVGPLARDLGLSVDGLEKRFRRGVGASPKQLASLLRLRRALRAHRQGSPLTQLALEAGYYDQAHFIRQVVAAVGMAPRAFLHTSEFCL